MVWTDECVREASRWLALGRDVLVTGERGSGRTTVLERTVAAPAVRAGLVLRGMGPHPFSTLTAHPSSPRPQGPYSPGPLIAWLAGEVRGSAALLAVDDLDLVDDDSLMVIRRVLEQTGARLIVSRDSIPSRCAPMMVQALLSSRAPAQVAISRLDFSQVFRMIEQRLGSAPDPEVTAVILAESAGMHRVAMALIDVARADRWLLPGVRGWAPHTGPVKLRAPAVVQSLTAELSAEQIEVLELLSLRPSVSVAELEHEPWAEVAAGLVARGRVITLRTPDDQHLLKVSPPALATALAERASSRRHLEPPHQYPWTQTGHSASPVEAIERMLLRGVTSIEDFRCRAAELAGLLRAKLTREQAEARITWQRYPGPAEAYALLEVLLRRPETAVVAEVMEMTEISPESRPEDITLFRAAEWRWLMWTGAAPEQVTAFLAEHGGDLEPIHAVWAQKADTVRAVHTGAFDRDLVRVDSLGPGYPRLDAIRVLKHAAGLMEAGRPDLALQVCEAQDDVAMQSDVRHQLEGVRCFSLTLLDQLDEAERAARSGLSTALADLDPFAIQVYATVLAEVAHLGGDPEAERQALTLLLQIGPPGAFDESFFARGLTLSALNTVRSGEVDLAEGLVSALEQIVDPESLTIDPMVGFAQLALTTRADSPGDQFWQLGESYAARGLYQPALFAWLMQPVPLTVEQFDRARKTFDQVHLPLLEHHLRLQEALTHRITEGLVARIDAIRDDRARVVDTALALLDPEDVPQRLAERGPGAEVEALSAREREVAALAECGMSNREIADQLVVSIRTVENHMSRVLRKLGLGSRTELRGMAEGPRY